MLKALGDLPELLITSGVELQLDPMIDDEIAAPVVVVSKTEQHKCGRCWRHLPDVTTDGALCSRCDQVVRGMDGAA